MLEEAPWGALNFNVLRGLLEGFQILQLQTGAEIGVLDGGTSMYLLAAFPKLQLVSVDPYKIYNEYDTERLAQAEQTAIQRLTPFGDRSIRVKESSVDAAKMVPAGRLDFVFIDADHSYEAVKEDMAAWYPALRPGGLFSGHDYRWAGVQQAVDEFASANNLKGYCSPKESDIWYLQKP
jgi:predicted O-methyltransferase YrrM